MKLLLIPIMVLMLSWCTVETSWSLHEKQMAKMDEILVELKKWNNVQDNCNCKKLPCLWLNEDTDMFLSDESVILQCIRATIDYRRIQ